VTRRGSRDRARADVARLSGNAAALLARIEGAAGIEELTWRPGADKWSLTEIVQHIALANSGMLRTARPAQWQAAWWEMTKSALITGVLRSSIKVKAPVPSIVPRPGVTWNQARGNLLGSAAKWSDFVEGDSFESTVFNHPIAGRLTAAATARFLADHLEHHARQVEQLFVTLKKTK
jgi:hypothetical protein